ncbi:hypothetical protein JHK85_056069 [Glycine max]|nr:hypothetical protein JHK85_056069 [Glycine max]
MAKSKMQEDIIKQNILNNKEDNRKRKSQMEGKEVFRGNKKFKSNVPQICPTGGKTSHILVFSEDLFFIYLLPPIIFNVRGETKTFRWFILLKSKSLQGKNKDCAPRNMIELSMVYDKIQTENGFSKLSTVERQEIQMKKAKLIGMLDEEDSRYVVVDIVLCSDSSLCLYFEQREQH